MIDTANSPSFGLILEKQNPNEFEKNQLRELLTTYGVLVFREHELDYPAQVLVMQNFGKIQFWNEQQAPMSFVHRSDPRMILLDNEDFLGKGRSAWHMDQTYLQHDYLPVRSLYCTSVEGQNITEFADITYLTDMVIEKYSLPMDTMARYCMNKTKHSERSVFSSCAHVGRMLLRYDNRMEFIGRDDSKTFKEFCTSILNGMEIPKLAVEWKIGDFVIFDNNRAPHRRSVMNGDCRLSRLTSTFWL